MKAIINNIPAFDATKGTTGSFITNTYITGFDLIIMDKTNTTKICDDIEVRESVNVFTIPANILSNNETYLLRIKTYEEDGREFISDPVIIECISEPSFDLLLNETLVNDIYISRSSTLDVGVQYSHATEKLNYYYVIIDGLDSYKSKNIYGDDRHTKIYDLRDNRSFRITAYGQTVNGMNLESKTITVNTSFIKNETFATLKASNNYKNACVDINASIKNVLYRFKNGDPEFIDELTSNIERTAVDLSNNVLEYYDGFTLYNTFSMFLEYKPTSNKELVLNLNNGEIVLVYGIEESKPYFEFRYNGKILIVNKDADGNSLETGTFYIVIYRNDNEEIKIDIRNR